MQSTQLLETILSRDETLKQKITAIQMETIINHAKPEEIEELITSGSLSVYQAFKLYRSGAYSSVDTLLECGKPCEPAELQQLMAFTDLYLIEIAGNPKCWRLVDHVTNLNLFDGASLAFGLLNTITTFPSDIKKKVIDAALDTIIDNDSGNIRVAHPILYDQPGTKRPLLELCDREQTYKFLRNISMFGCIDHMDLELVANKLEITRA